MPFGQPRLRLVEPEFLRREEVEEGTGDGVLDLEEKVAEGLELVGNADWHERWLSVVNTPENQPADGAHETAKRESGSDRLFETPIISIHWQLDF